MPMWAMWLPSGPMENGTTYMVRPSCSRRTGLSVARISAGAIQLLVGPASSFFRSRCRCGLPRATSDGSDRARKLLGRLAGFSFEGAGVDQLLAQAVVFFLGTVFKIEAALGL